MNEPSIAPEDPTPRPVSIDRVVTLAEAHADRAARARRHASDCVLLALVTSPEISAQLIDSAIEYVRWPDNGLATDKGETPRCNDAAAETFMLA